MTQEYTAKYRLHRVTAHYPGKRGRPRIETDWIMDRHAGYAKHRAQARYRNEAYELTEQMWNDIWTHNNWHNKGRGKHDLTLYRLDNTSPWHIDNVVLIEQCDKGQYYQEDRNYGGRPPGSKNK